MTRRAAAAILLALALGFALGRATVTAAPRSEQQPAGHGGPVVMVAAPSEASHLGGVSPSPVVVPPSEASRPAGGPSGTPGAAESPASPGRGAVLQGVASWYRYVPGQAAAGPRLRALLGPGWRGMVVTVGGIPVRLTDWCQCFEGTATERVIDLDARTFAQLAPLGRGLVTVEVRA